MQNRVKNRTISDNFGKIVATAFSKEWPEIATKIINYYSAKKLKKKIGITEVKDFMEKYSAEIDEGNFFLPYCTKCKSLKF